MPAARGLGERGGMTEDFPQAETGLRPGSWVGGYRLEERIGQGGMALVFRAHDERLGRTVALKVLAPALAADKGFRLRFIRESRAAAHVDDPHIIPIFEAGEAGLVLFIAMRYVGGGDVRSLLRRLGALPARRLAAIVSPVASALDAAHAAGLVHRDVKPANMLLDTRPGRPDHVYLSDFGLSKEVLGSVGLTGSGQFLGTVDYAAPEQIGGQVADGRADQYALGCTAFEMICGQPPFRRELGMAALMAHLHDPPPAVSSLRPGLPAELDEVFARVLAKSPQDRYPNCRQFADALRITLGVGPYNAAQTDDIGLPYGHPATEVANLSPIEALDDTVTSGWAGDYAAARQPSPLPPAQDYGRANIPRLSGDRAPKPARWPLLAGAAAAIAVVAAAVSVTVLLATRNPTSSTGNRQPATASSAGNAHPVTGRPAASPSATVSGTTPVVLSSPAAATNIWIAQLASVPVSDGAARLNAVLEKVRRHIPAAQVLGSSLYASLRPGFWVVYYAGSFTDGTQALTYCAAHGRTTRNQCIGRYLSHNPADYYDQCYPPASAATSACYRP